jgi:hypothetical protein
MATRTPSAKLKRQILQQRGIQLAKHTKKPMTFDELPSIIKRTPLMRLMELKFHDKLENIIFDGSIYKTAKKLRVNPVTISKWRRVITQAQDKRFWAQFPEKNKQKEIT